VLLLLLVVVVSSRTATAGAEIGGTALLRSAIAASRLVILWSASCFSSVTRLRSLMRRNCDDSCLTALFVLLDVVDVVTVLVVVVALVIVGGDALLVVSR